MINFQALQHELLDLEADIKCKQRRRRDIIRVLKEANQAFTGEASFFAKPIVLYVLELEGQNYYVGQTRDVQSRYNRHSSGEGARWTQLHKPVRIVKTVETGLIDEKRAAELEDALTVETARVHGFERTRGGRYSRVDQHYPRRLTNPNSWREVPDLN